MYSYATKVKRLPKPCRDARPLCGSSLGLPLGEATAQHRGLGEAREPRRVVLTSELRRLWLGWCGPVLLLALSICLSLFVVMLVADARGLTSAGWRPCSCC
jgi:hypothetical protein